MKSVLALDLGATSCKSILYSIENNKIISKEIHRFKNVIHPVRGQLSWDIEFLIHNILESIKIAENESELISVGIDTWGVDFVLIDANGQILIDPVCYRDSRTIGILDKISRYSSLNELYFKTGNQIMEINTLFQLIVCKEKTPEVYFKANKLLMISDYINYYLTGLLAVERSIASTMQMLNPLTKEWNKEVLNTFEISEYLLPPLVSEGNILGKIHEHIAKNALVINVCQHDTASAVAALPQKTDGILYISCGTWSLIGTELKVPVLTEKALYYNFTNEAGHDNTNRLLKNCTGLWIIEELRQSFNQTGQNFTYEEIINAVEKNQDDVPIFDTDSPIFVRPGNMIEKITHYFKKQKIAIGNEPGILFKIVYHSLAQKYKDVIAQLEEITDKAYKQIDFIGGGSKSDYFSQLIADVTGKTVITGLYEATSLGNALVQFQTLGYIKDLASAKELINQSVTFNYFYPCKEERK